jgi:hypothetical protein
MNYKSANEYLQIASRLVNNGWNPLVNILNNGKEKVFIMIYDPVEDVIDIVEETISYLTQGAVYFQTGEKAKLVFDTLTKEQKQELFTENMDNIISSDDLIAASNQGVFDFGEDEEEEEEPEPGVLTKEAVEEAVNDLLDSNGTTTTLEIKNHLRDLGYHAEQQDVSEYMQDVMHDLRLRVQSVTTGGKNHLQFFR